MTDKAPVNDMAEPPRPVLLLFMGENEDHAITSFQRFFPASVHIVTSEMFSEKYDGMLTEWSENYGFRRGKVCTVDDLFKPSAVNSLIAASCEALNDEVEHTDESERGSLMVGITGGTMHMAVTGTYLAQLVGGTVFYVLRPPEGQHVLPARDVVIFPELRSLRTALGTMIPDIHYLMSTSEGKVEDLFEQSNINDYYLQELESNGLIDVEGDTWKLTDLGLHSFGFVSKSRLWNDFHMVLSNLSGDGEKGSDDSPMHV